MSNKNEFDKAFQLFHDKKYQEAIAVFDQLLADENTESWMTSRLQQFKAIAQRQVAGAEPMECSLKTYSFFMNLNQFDKAEEVLAQLDLQESDQIYLRAELAMERGDKSGAIALLKKAVALNHDNAGYALNSPSFSEAASDEDFNFLREDSKGGNEAA